MRQRIYITLTSLIFYISAYGNVQQIAMFGVNSDVQGIELWHNYFFLDE